MASTPPEGVAGSTTSLMGIDAEGPSVAEERTALLDMDAGRAMNYASGVATPNTCTPPTHHTLTHSHFHYAFARLQSRRE
jgi:hypothetical protein